MKEEAKQQLKQAQQIKRLKTATWILIVFAILISIFIYVKNIPPPPGEYDSFARCITASGAKFYGAFWCPHCAAQKALFGSSEQYLPYTECSLPDESGQTQVCIDKGIETYPTWYFADGTTSTGETSLETLSAKTGCALPGAAAPISTSTLSTSTGASSPAFPTQ